MRILCVLNLVVFLSLSLPGCSQSRLSEPVSNTATAGEYTLTVRGGITNIDSSFLQSSSVRTQAQQIQRLQTLERILQKNYGIRIQTTSAVGVNLFASLLKNGVALASETPLVVSGSQGIYNRSDTKLAAGQAWAVLFPLPPSGSGIYNVRADIGGSLTAGVNLSLPSNTNGFIGSTGLFPLAVGLQINANKNYAAVSWKPVTGAQSYVALIYRPDTNTVVWSTATKSTNLQVSQIALDTNKIYELDVLALSWDTTLPSQSPFPTPLPERFDASAVAQSLIPQDPSLSILQKNLNLSTSPGSSVIGNISFANGSQGPLNYQISLGGRDATAFKPLSSTSGILIKIDPFNPASLNFQFQATCPATEGDLFAYLNLSTNDPISPNLILPINLECSFPSTLQASRIAFKPSFFQVDALAWSPDGTTVAAVGNDGFGSNYQMVLWDAGSGESRQVVGLSTIAITAHSLAWSPDSKKLIVALGDSGKVIGPNGQVLLTLNGTNLTRAAWSPDGSKVALGSSSQIVIFDANTGQSLRAISYQSAYSNSYVNLLWDTNTQVMIHTDRGIAIYDANDGSLVRTLLNQAGQGTAPAGPIALTSDRSLVVGYLSGLSLGVWDVATGTLQRSFAIDDNLSDLKISPDNNYIALFYQLSRAIQIKNLRDGTTVSSLSTLDQGSGQLSWNPNSTQVAASDGSQLLRIWDISSQQPVKVLGYHPGTIGSFQFGSAPVLVSSSPFYYRTTLTVKPSGIINTYDPRQGTRYQQIIPNAIPQTAQWITGTSRIAAIINTSQSLTAPPLLEVWDTSGTVTASYSLSLPSSSTLGWAWSPDGSRLAYGPVTSLGPSVNPPWQLVATETGQVLVSLEGTDPYLVAAWKPDGKEIAAATNSNIYIFDTTSGKLLRTISSGTSSDLVWTTNNKIIALYSNSQSYDVAVFDPDTGNVLLNESGGNFRTVSLDGRREAILNNDVIQIISLASERKLLEFQRILPLNPNRDAVIKMSWSSDGSYLALGTVGGNLEVWKLTSTP